MAQHSKLVAPDSDSVSNAEPRRRIIVSLDGDASSGAALPGSGGGGRWQFRSGTGWKDFSPEASRVVEGARAAGLRKATFEIMGVQYELFFAALRQHPVLEPDKSREVRRLSAAGSEGEADAAAAAAAAHGREEAGALAPKFAARRVSRIPGRWQFYAGTGDTSTGWSGWTDFPEEVSQAVERAHAQGLPKATFEVKGLTYELNFAVWQQHLVADPEKRRSVRRVVGPMSLPDVPEEASLSAVGLAMYLVTCIRVHRDLKHVVNFDLAVAFVRRMRRLLQDRGEALVVPRVLYHWTTSQHVRAIETWNLQVPGRSTKVEHRSDKGWYGQGIYTCPRFKCEANKAFNSSPGARCFLCLGLPGRQHQAYVVNDIGRALVRGYDSHVSADRKDGDPGDQLVFFSPDQLLPSFEVSDRDWDLGEVALQETTERLLKCLLEIPEGDAARPIAELVRTSIPYCGVCTFM